MLVASHVSGPNTLGAMKLKLGLYYLTTPDERPLLIDLMTVFSIDLTISQLIQESLAPRTERGK